MDSYADDLVALFETLDLKDTAMVGHSTGGGELAKKRRVTLEVAATSA